MVTRTPFGLAIGFAAVTILSAQAADISPGLKACRAISDDSARARCYDRIVDEASPPPVASRTPAPAPKATPPAPPAPTQQPPRAVEAQRFGEKDLPRAQQPAAPAELDEIVAKVTVIARDQHGRVTVTLDNGQIWRQADSDAIVVRVGNSVTVKRGAMGAYYLVPETTRRSYQVRRIQ